MATRRAVFLDRDGVINPLIYHRDAGIVDSPFTVWQFILFPRAARAIRLLNDLGLPVVVVSNQPGIAKRHFTVSTFHLINAKLHAAVASAGARLDAVYYCLHHPEAKIQSLRVRCACRKPRIGLLTRAARELGLDLDAPTWWVTVFRIWKQGFAPGAARSSSENGSASIASSSGRPRLVPLFRPAVCGKRPT